MPAISWEPDGSTFPSFSAVYSSRTNPAGSRSGRRSPHNSMATFRVLVPMPLSSMKRTVGCKDTTTIEPGGSGFSLDRKGWSIHPPAKAIRYGNEPIALVISGEGVCKLFTKRPFIMHGLERYVCLLFDRRTAAQSRRRFFRGRTGRAGWVPSRTLA
jgi:hypothetical protein